MTTLTRSPSDQTFAIETRDFTLVWDYTLDGSVLFAQFLNVTGGGAGDTIARRVQGGSLDVDPKYQDRFTVVITDSQASLKIRGAQSSDQGKYRFTLSATGSGNILHEVEVIVQGTVICQFIPLNKIPTYMFSYKYETQLKSSKRKQCPHKYYYSIDYREWEHGGL